MNRTPVVPAALLVFALLSSPVPGAAQALRVGGGLGVSLSTFGGDGIDGLDGHRTGVAGGLTVSYSVAPNLRLESGAWWVEQGAEGTVQGFEEPISAEQRLSYLRIPLFLRFVPFPGSPIRPSVGAGPGVSIETRCRTRRDPGVVGEVVGCDDAGRRGTDVGFLFGAGLSWDLGGLELLLEGVYALGLRDIGSVDAIDTRNRGFVLTPRVSLPLGR